MGVISGNLDRDVVIRLTTEDTVDGASGRSNFFNLISVIENGGCMV